MVDCMFGGVLACARVCAREFVTVPVVRVFERVKF